mgnify:CR=1 FL=1
MAANHTREQIREFLGADSLGYLSLEGMIAATGLPAREFCAACYTGQYPTQLVNIDELMSNRERR